MSEISEKRVEAMASNILECHDVKPSEVKALARELRALRKILDGVTQEAIDGGWTARGLSDYAKQLETERAALRERAEPDYIRYDCGCCGWETIEDWRDNDACPKCNHKPMGKTELYAEPPAPVVADGHGNLPCPFCGGKCDPSGWLGTYENGVPTFGPECEECGATADTIDKRNARN